MSPAFERKRIRLNANTLGVLTADGKQTALIVPRDSVIEVINQEPDDRKMIDIRWDGKILSMFAEDVAGRGVTE
jgi:hypothetical protein